MKFYCYTKCSTCQKAKKFLEEKNVKYEMIDIKNAEFSVEDIKFFHEKSEKDLRKLFNTHGTLYKELKLKDKVDALSLEEAYDLLKSDGMLLKRPILVKGNKVLIGFDQKEYEALLYD